MKRIKVLLECSHEVFLEVTQVPAQANHLHAACGQCRGGLFSVIRVLQVEDVVTAEAGEAAEPEAVAEETAVEEPAETKEAEPEKEAA